MPSCGANRRAWQRKVQMLMWHAGHAFTPGAALSTGYQPAFAFAIFVQRLFYHREFLNCAQTRNLRHNSPHRSCAAPAHVLVSIVRELESRHLHTTACTAEPKVTKQELLCMYVKHCGVCEIFCR